MCKEKQEKNICVALFDGEMSDEKTQQLQESLIGFFKVLQEWQEGVPNG